jgi:mannosyltransferase
VGVLLVPMALVSRAQSAQLAWVRRPTVETAQGVLRTFLGPTDGVYWTCLGLAVVGLMGLVGRRGELTCAGVALPLVVVPPVVLMLVSQVSPLYVDRYVLYALSGAPVLVAAGADRVAGVVGRLRPGGRRVPTLPHSRLRSSGGTPIALRDDCPHDDGKSYALPLLQSLLTLAGVLAVLLAAVQQLPLLRDDRVPVHRPDDLAAVSRAAARVLRPGEPVLFLPVQARNAALAYPGAFRGVRDVGLGVSAAESGTLYGQEADAGTLRRRVARLDRVWVVADRNLLAGRWSPNSQAEQAKLAFLAQEFVPVEESVSGAVTVRLYVRRSAVSRSPASPPAPPGPALPSPASPRPARR